MTAEVAVSNLQSHLVNSPSCSQPIDAALRDEAAFLKKRYPLLAGKNGTPFLAKRLNKVFSQRRFLLSDSTL